MKIVGYYGKRLSERIGMVKQYSVIELIIQHIPELELHGTEVESAKHSPRIHWTGER